MNYALQNPVYALKSLAREVSSADEKFLSRLTGSEASALKSFLNEPVNTDEFASSLRSAEAEMNRLSILSADLYAKKILLQYATIRAFKPKVVVETGVANGVSSAYLLLALRKNSSGMLYSIEVGDRSYLPPGRENGWIVPEFLRDRWVLRFGNSKELLPKLVAEVQPVDVFIHDSLHSYEHMYWEFRAAFPYLRSGGILISDDALWNRAFPDFATEVAAKEAQIIRGIGFLRKV
jgi:predicted O-methyltransferase YrrM